MVFAQLNDNFSMKASKEADRLFNFFVDSGSGTTVQVCNLRQLDRLIRVMNLNCGNVEYIREPSLCAEFGMKGRQKENRLTLDKLKE